MSRYADAIRVMTDIVDLNVVLSPQEFVTQCEEFLRYPVETINEFVTLLKCLLVIYSNNSNGDNACFEVISLIIDILIVNQSLWISRNDMEMFYYCVLFKVFEMDQSCQQEHIHVDPKLVQKIERLKYICIQDNFLEKLCPHNLFIYYFNTFTFETTELLQVIHKCLTLTQKHPTTLLIFRRNMRNITSKILYSSKLNSQLWRNISKIYVQQSGFSCCLSLLKKEQILSPCMNPPVTEWCKVHEKRRKRLNKKLILYTNLPLDLIRMIEYYGI